MKTRTLRSKSEIRYAVLVRVYMVAAIVACCYLPLLLLNRLTTIGAIAGTVCVAVGLFFICRRPTENLPVLINIIDIVLLVPQILFLAIFGIQVVSDAPLFGVILIVGAILHGFAAAWLFEDLHRMHWVISSWMKLLYLAALPIFAMLLLAATQGCNTH